MSKYQKALDYLGKKSERPWAKATRIRVDSEKAVHVRYHDTDVVTLQADGTVTLRTGGWPTVTTMARMNEWLPEGVRVDGSTLRRGRFPKKMHPWMLYSRTLESEQVAVIPFVPTGEDTPRVWVDYNSYFMASPFDGKGGMGSVTDERVEDLTLSVDLGEM
jgi:hypothetical protein